VHWQTERRSTSSYRRETESNRIISESAPKPRETSLEGTFPLDISASYFYTRFLLSHSLEAVKFLLVLCVLNRPVLFRVSSLFTPISSYVMLILQCKVSFTAQLFWLLLICFFCCFRFVYSYACTALFLCCYRLPANINLYKSCIGVCITVVRMEALQHTVVGECPPTLEGKMSERKSIQGEHFPGGNVRHSGRKRSLAESVRSPLPSQIASRLASHRYRRRLNPG